MRLTILIISFFTWANIGEGNINRPLALNEYSVNYTRPGLDGKTCLMMKARITILLRYTMNTNKLSDWTTVNITSNATGQGNCNGNILKPNSYEQLTIALYNMGKWTLSLTFTNDTNVTNKTDGSSFILSSIVLQTPFSNLPSWNAKNNITHKTSMGGQNGLLTSVPVERSLFCKSGLTNIALDQNTKITITNIQLQAFQTQDYSNRQFIIAHRCEGDHRKPDVIPIIVGGCLAGLVFIVTLGYLIGSAKKKTNSVWDVASGSQDKDIPISTETLSETVVEKQERF